MQYSIFDDMTLCSEQEIARLLPLVSKQRREQALRYTHLFGQFCCLKSYTMLIELLVKWMGKDDIVLPEFLYNQYGAPSIENGPYFSISHCKSGIAVAVSDAPIGIDIESIRTPKVDLVRKTMNSVEQSAIFSAANPDWAFTRLWTQKEALLKMKGTGIIADLHDVLLDSNEVVFTQVDNLEHTYTFCVAQPNRIL